MKYITKSQSHILKKNFIRIAAVHDRFKKHDISNYHFRGFETRNFTIGYPFY